MSLLTRLSVLTRLSLLTRLRSRTTRARVAADRPVPDEQSGDPAPDAGGWRPVAGRVITVLAGLLVLVALVAPNQLDQVTLGAFVRIPAEAIVGVALVLVLPPKVRWVVAAVGGAVLGLLTILKVLDMGFNEVLERPFDPVLDWTLLADGVDYLVRSLGGVRATVAVAGAVLLAVAVPVVMTLAVLRLTRVVAGHRRPAIRTGAVLGAVWVVCALLGVQVVPGVPVASATTATLAYERAGTVGAGLRDQQAFAGQSAVDAFRDTPADQLLTGLRGKDVIVAFVESYGRVAVRDPQFAPAVSALLADGDQRLRAAGYASRSAYVTSPTFGGGSWLAHSTLQSGLWINNQQRYNNLLASDRLTLNRAFDKAGWRTVDVVPAVNRAWPEGGFYGFNQIYTVQNLGYRGPTFNFSSMPDQYTMSFFQRTERAPGHRPVMAEIDLLSSHSPWAPLPHLRTWNDIGDGSVFRGLPSTDDQPGVDPARIRTAYLHSIEYSLSTVISYVQTYGDDNLVLVFLGDHQPASVVSGDGASHDAPITIVARDHTVLDRISGWGWQDGLEPAAQAPVWRMDTFRDRFLTAFGPPTH